MAEAPSAAEAVSNAASVVTRSAHHPGRGRRQAGRLGHRRGDRGRRRVDQPEHRRGDPGHRQVVPQEHPRREPGHRQPEDLPEHHREDSPARRLQPQASPRWWSPLPPSSSSPPLWSSPPSRRRRRRHRRGGVAGDGARCVAGRAIDGAPFGELPGLCFTGRGLFCVGTIAVLPERRRWTGTGKLIGDHRLVDDANRIAIGAAGACRDDAGGRHDQGANTCCQERPAAAAGVDRRRLGASEMCVSHAIVHGLVGQGSEASDEVVVVHNVYIVAGSQGDMGSVEGR